MSKGNAKWNTRDLCQKHVDDGSLFTAIRYHSLPFAAPPTEVIVTEVPKQKVLEIEVIKKFQTGNYRLANLLTTLGTLIKPLFLGCILPFYCGFYVLPVWSFSLATKWLKKIREPIRRGSNKLKALAASICAPFQAAATKMKKLRNQIYQYYSYLADILKGKFLRSDKQQIFSCLKNWRQFPAQLMSKCAKSIGNRLSARERSLCRMCHNIEARINSAIKAPFIYLYRRSLAAVGRIYQNFLVLPMTKANNWVQAPRRVIAAKKVACYSAIKRMLTHCQSTLSGLRIKLPFSVSALGTKSIKMRVVGLVSAMQLTFNRFSASVREYLPNLQRIAESISKPKEQYLRIKKAYNQYKSDVRQFAIHLPSRIKEQLPIVIEHYSKRLLALLERINLRRQTLANNFRQLIPAPLRQICRKVQDIAEKISIILGSFTALIQEKMLELAFFILLMRVWTRVILRHAKELVISHQWANFHT